MRPRHSLPVRSTETQGQGLSQMEQKRQVWGVANAPTVRENEGRFLGGDDEGYIA